MLARQLSLIGVLHRNISFCGKPQIVNRHYFIMDFSQSGLICEKTNKRSEVDISSPMFLQLYATLSNS